MIRSKANTVDRDEDFRRFLDRKNNPGAADTASIHSDEDAPSVYSVKTFATRRTFREPVPSFYSSADSHSQHQYHSNRDTRYSESSMLDIEDDDDRSITTSPTAQRFDHDDIDNEPVDEQPADEDDDPRMSVLGPKIRMHTKAPWEMDGEAFREEDEDDSDVHLGLNGHFDPPRMSADSRNSSGSSGISRMKQSDEFTRSMDRPPNGGLYALSALAPTPLVTTPKPKTKSVGSAFKNKFTKTRAPVQIPSNGSRTPSPLPSPLPSSGPFHTSPKPNGMPGLPRRGSTDSARPHSSTPRYEVNSHPERAFSPPTFPRDSNASDYPNGVAQSDTHSTISSMLPTSSSRPRNNTLQGKGISGPIPGHHRNSSASSMLRQTPEPSLFPGWNNTGSPMNLISLEEAQAQRLRNVGLPRPSDVSMNNVSFPEGGSESQSTAATSSVNRLRSVSAGANKAKSAFHTIANVLPSIERKDSEPGSKTPRQPPPESAEGKSLKHKKSGFMRMFGGKEEAPPLPSTLGQITPFNQLAPSISPQPRVAVPTLDGLFKENGIAGSQPPSPSNPGFDTSPAKRLQPGLSINTSPYATTEPAPVSAKKPPSSAAPARSNTSWLAPPSSSKRAGPQSAPPESTDFPALKLRPVSSMFSAQFASIIGDETTPKAYPQRSQSSPSDQALTPASTSPVGMPTTPLSSTYSLGGSPSPSFMTIPIPEHNRGDPSAVIQALHEQMNASKKAWQAEVWKLENQIRDLKAEVKTLRTQDGGKDACEACGRGGAGLATKSSVLDRPRPRTGTTSGRFAAIGPD